MKNIVFLLIFMGISMGSNAQNIPVYPSFSALNTRLNAGGDTVFVLNFWATWCKPCMAELPYLEELHKNYGDKKVKVLLVCLDFKNQLDRKVKPFIQSKQLKAEVVLLADEDASSWIGRVDSKWNGDIPATLIKKGNATRFVREALPNYKKLEAYLLEIFK